MSAAETEPVVDLVCRADGVSVVRLPLAGSCAVPLSVQEPEGVALLAWAFTGFTGRALSDPACLLVLGHSGDGPVPGETVTIRGHVRDFRGRVGPGPAAMLSPQDGRILAQAVVAALAPENAGRLAGLLPLLASGLDALAVPEAAGGPALTLGRGEAVATALDFVPDYVLARGAEGYACLGVSAARLRSDPHPVMTLTLAQQTPDRTAVDRAILAGGGRCVAVACAPGA